MNIVEKNLEFIIELCDKFNVSRLYLFGSVLNGGFTEKSDIDFLVNFNQTDYKLYADDYFGLKFSLEDHFNRPVDLLEEKTLNNPFFKKEIDISKKLIYGK